jgi:hypothetical protein
MASDLPNIVLIGGAGAGKSTAADWLVTDLDYRRLGFAGVAGQQHKGSPRDWVARAWGPEYVNDREKLITVANAARSVDEDVWLNSLLRELEWEERPVVVDDCRFANEYFGLLGRGFVSVRVLADDERRENRLRANGKWIDGYLDHEIEHYLDGVTPGYTIYNDGDLDEFFGDLMDIVARERRRR